MNLIFFKYWLLHYLPFIQEGINPYAMLSALGYIPTPCYRHWAVVIVARPDIKLHLISYIQSTIISILKKKTN